MHSRFARSLVAASVALILSAPALAQSVPTPEQYFGFKIGADGELARYPKILEYFQLLAKQTDRIKYEELGKTTMGNSYNGIFRYSRLLRLASSRSRSRSIRRLDSSVILPSRSRTWMNFRSAAINSRVSSVPAAETS